LSHNRADADGFPAGGDCAFAVAQGVERRRKIGKIGRVLPVPRNGHADQFHGDIVPPELFGKNAHQMERVRMVGLRREDAAIAGLGVLQPPRLLVRNPRCQEPGNLGIAVWLSAAAGGSARSSIEGSVIGRHERGELSAVIAKSLRTGEADEPIDVTVPGAAA
jgi:hypothetical protein